MERQIKIFQIGCGKMSKYILRYATEKKCQIVGAVDTNENLIGTDIGTIFESEKIGITVQDSKNLEKLLKETKPDIAIVTTLSVLNDIGETLRICASCGLATERRVPPSAAASCRRS